MEDMDVDQDAAVDMGIGLFKIVLVIASVVIGSCIIWDVSHPKAQK